MAGTVEVVVVESDVVGIDVVVDIEVVVVIEVEVVVVGGIVVGVVEAVD